MNHLHNSSKWRLNNSLDIMGVDPSGMGMVFPLQYFDWWSGLVLYPHSIIKASFTVKDMAYSKQWLTGNKRSAVFWGSFCQKFRAKKYSFFSQAIIFVELIVPPCFALGMQWLISANNFTRLPPHHKIKSSHLFDTWTELILTQVWRCCLLKQLLTLFSMKKSAQIAIILVVGCY